MAWALTTWDYTNAQTFSDSTAQYDIIVYNMRDI